MIISARLIKKPRKLHWCDMCGNTILGPHLRVYGRAWSSDPAWAMRECLDCAKHSKEPKIMAAMEAM